MQASILVEPKFGPVPKELTVVADYGPEMVATGDPLAGAPPTSLTTGTVMFLEGPPEAFANWLRLFDGVWTSRSPMMGAWTVKHIREGL